MDRALTVILGLVAGGVVVLLIAAFVLTTSSSDDGSFEVTFTPVDTEFPSVEHDPDAALALIDAWTSRRTGTYVATGTWTRTVDGRTDPLVGEIYVAQDPPRRYALRLGAELVDINDPERFQTLLVDELALVGGYVTGDTRLYAVGHAAPGCFHVELVVAALASPWGRWAEYCFDDATGALVSARVRRQSAVDVERIDQLRGDVTEADFPPS